MPSDTNLTALGPDEIQGYQQAMRDVRRDLTLLPVHRYHVVLPPAAPMAAHILRLERLPARPTLFGNPLAAQFLERCQSNERSQALPDER